MRTLKNLLLVISFLSVFVSSAYAGGSCQCSVPRTFGATASDSDSELTGLAPAGVDLTYSLHYYNVIGPIGVAISSANVHNFSLYDTNIASNSAHEQGIWNHTFRLSTEQRIQLSCYVEVMGGDGESSAYASISW